VVTAVLDTGALLAYTRGSDTVGEVLLVTADYSDIVVIPATCLAAAYRDVDERGWDLLDLLTALDHVSIAPLEHEHCAVLGGWARHLGLDTAHAAIEAANLPVTPLITANRDLVTLYLPADWPIIDV
jgi:hypothetical protein